MALVSKLLLLLWSIIWAFSSFLLYSSLSFPLIFFFFYSFCSSQSLMSLLNYPASASTFPPSVLPSSLSSTQRLSLWQTWAITRTLWIIARLSIKGVISPQWTTPWQEWAPLPRCRCCPVAPGPSAISTTASSAPASEETIERLKVRGQWDCSGCTVGKWERLSMELGGHKSREAAMKSGVDTFHLS